MIHKLHAFLIGDMKNGNKVQSEDKAIMRYFLHK
jgi:hypothetical protein